MKFIIHRLTSSHRRKPTVDFVYEINRGFPTMPQAMNKNCHITVVSIENVHLGHFP